jgi:glucokinase
VILAGDVGGTKTALALWEPDGTGMTLVRDAVLRSAEFPTFQEAIARFLAAGAAGPIDAASFGIAGPVVAGRVTTTNLPWVIDEADLMRSIPARRVRLLNDLEAVGRGIGTLPDSSIVTLQAGEPRPGNRALIAAGTGLGKALIVGSGRDERVIASEGGHADFAPRTDDEIELLRFLRREHGHVSCERVLSGPGFFNIYRFLRDTGRGTEPGWLSEAIARADDPNAVIGPAASGGKDPLCAATLAMFVALYGAEAGNLALESLAVGGVYVGGGIAPRFRQAMEGGGFIDAFRAKGRFSGFMASVPVRLLLEPRTALLGAARTARELLDAPAAAAPGRG